MREAKILVLVGMPGAGKSTCVDYLTEQGVPSVYFGGVVVDETKRRYGKVTEALERKVREDLRAKEGKGAVAKRIIQKIDGLAADGHYRVVADGLYSWTEYKMFKERWGDNAIIVAITAARHLRHKRLAHRPVRPLTEKEVTAREYAEIENLEKGGPIANADYTLTNNTTPADLLKQLGQVLTETGFLKKIGGPTGRSHLALEFIIELLCARTNLWLPRQAPATMDCVHGNDSSIISAHIPLAFMVANLDIQFQQQVFAGAFSIAWLNLFHSCSYLM